MEKHITIKLIWGSQVFLFNFGLCIQGKLKSTGALIWFRFRHDYTETDVIDAIVYRKPVALKAVYYLIEKRLNQGLTFPESDFTYTDNDNPSLKQNGTTNNQHAQLSNRGTPTTTGSASGVVKHNSQLLPKRHSVGVTIRSGSQKNVDFKSIFNNMNINSTNNSNGAANPNPNLNRYGSNVSRESTATTANNANNYSNSPSPDFLANAMSPAKGTAQNNGNAGNYSTSNRNSRQTNYDDNRRQTMHSTTSNYEPITRNPNSAASNSTTNTRKSEYRQDRYYVPVHGNGTPNGRTSVNDDYSNNYYTENRNTPSNASVSR